MAKIPRALTKQIENLEEIIKSLNGLIDGSKVKLENYDEDFLKTLSDIRKKGLELRDDIQVFKNSLEKSLADEYDSSSRFASDQSDSVKITERVISSFISKNANYD